MPNVKFVSELKSFFSVYNEYLLKPSMHNLYFVPASGHFQGNTNAFVI